MISFLGEYMLIKLIITIFFFVHIFFLIAVKKKNFSVIDIGWSLGILLVAIISFLHYPLSLRNALVLTLVSLWALRLSSYIFLRGRGKGEDKRYTRFRNEWRPHENIQAYLKVFLFQGVLMLIVSLPVSIGMTSEVRNLSWINIFGFLIFSLGFIIEVWADSYLEKWKARSENRGLICTTGPWSMCRFPNYFGEVLLWYGLYFSSFDLSHAWTIIGPLVINFLILKVTGVPPLEEKYLKRADYQDYAKKVSRFIPFLRKFRASTF